MNKSLILTSDGPMVIAPYKNPRTGLTEPYCPARMSGNFCLSLQSRARRSQMCRAALSIGDQMNFGFATGTDASSGQFPQLIWWRNTLWAIARLSTSTFLIAWLAACASDRMLMLPQAPSVRTGDTTLTVTITTGGRDQLPQGSAIVITLADISKGLDNPPSIAGDTVHMSQPDQKVRISLPVDRSQINVCRRPNFCGLYVRVVKDGRVLFGNRSPVPYRAGQKLLNVMVGT